MTGNAAGYRTRAASACAAAAIALAQRWVGPGWRKDRYLRPLFDTLWAELVEPKGDGWTVPSSVTPFIGDYNGVNLNAPAGWSNRNLIDDEEGLRRAWSSLGHTPEAIADVVAQVVDTVYVNWYSQWDGARAVDALTRLEKLTAMDGYLLPPATFFADESNRKYHWWKPRTEEQVRHLRLALQHEVPCIAPRT